MAKAYVHSYGSRLLKIVKEPSIKEFDTVKLANEYITKMKATARRRRTGYSFKLFKWDNGKQQWFRVSKDTPYPVRN